MPTPIYAIGNTPLFLLGLEKLFCASAYSWQGCFAPTDTDFLPDEEPAPFLVILQLAGPYAANLKYIQKMRRQYPQALLFLLCDDDEAKHVKSFFLAGIKAYALPTIDPDTLCQALQQLTQGQSFIDPRLSQQWIRTKMGFSEEQLSLTRREREVLNLIVEEYTTREIAEKLYISPCTAETHRGNIIQKMGVRNTAGIVREAIRLGW
ncbi:MAG: hypothetical protein DA408_06900 [Bacteroidetes bacterium]|nr:MAG: hypothetical protein C7N36_17180 [Bacteroidota bacterium]PTM13433.1 MAG: hypothetical protein DA408_06900 [Bacteroidota bacterium]